MFASLQVNCKNNEQEKKIKFLFSIHKIYSHNNPNIFDKNLLTSLKSQSHYPMERGLENTENILEVNVILTRL